MMANVQGIAEKSMAVGVVTAKSAGVQFQKKSLFAQWQAITCVNSRCKEHIGTVPWFLVDCEAVIPNNESSLRHVYFLQLTIIKFLAVRACVCSRNHCALLESNRIVRPSR
jgi:hypothetical protein